jgi:glycosyltransferase involved in cell wall biosynthesis
VPGSFIAFLRKISAFKIKLQDWPKDLEGKTFDLIHFPFQNGFKTHLPNLYQPHDLQHLHLPMFFSRDVVEIRKQYYALMLNQANVVIVGNESTKKDFLSFYPSLNGKILNIPLSVQPLSRDNYGLDVRELFGMKRFIFYPANGWPHKNHKRLLEAFSKVVKIYDDLTLVLTGSNLKDNKEINLIVNKLGLIKSVKILGYVDVNTLTALYIQSTGVIVPTLFESASYPIWEAMCLGTPVASSNVTSLPSQTKNQSYLFNPLSVDQITSAINYLVNDSPLRTSRISLGQQRVKEFDQGNFMCGIKYAYRRALGTELNENDMHWIENGNTF